MAKKLYVGNLPYNTTDSDLQNLFSQAGTVTTATVVSDKYSGRSRGFGFVEMSSDDEAARAIETLNGHELEGRKMVVNEARPATARPPRQGFGRQRSFRSHDNA